MFLKKALIFLRYIRKYLQMRWQMSGICLKIIFLGEKGELKKRQPTMIWQLLKLSNWNRGVIILLSLLFNVYEIS